jgi:hypothetical protein
MVGPQIGECVRNRPKVVHGARCVCGVYEIYNSSAQLRAVALVLCIHMFAHTCISEMTSSVTVFCVKRLRCREREIYRALWSPRLRWIDACIVVTLHHFLCIHFPSASLSNSLCVHSTNCITTFCSSTKKVDEEATPANFP